MAPLDFSTAVTVVPLLLVSVKKTKINNENYKENKPPHHSWVRLKFASDISKSNSKDDYKHFHLPSFIQCGNLTYSHGRDIMANNVFGNPITNETLEGMPEYVGKQITRKDRAHVAMQMKNAENKDHNASDHVKQLKKDFGDGISTLCVIYNATGDGLKFITSHDYHGHIYKEHYPTIIQNGQWAAFLHVKPSLITAGSSAAVVYRGKNQSDYQCDWMLAWSIPYVGDNHAYTEIRDADHYKESKNRWGIVSDKMGNSGLTCEDNWNHCVSNVSIGEDTSPMYVGIMTLEGA